MDEGAGEGWGEDAALVIDEGTINFQLRYDFLFVVQFFHNNSYQLDYRRRIW